MRCAALPHPQRAADAQHRGRFDIVHAADVVYRRAVSAGYCTQRIARLDAVILHGGLFGGLLLVLLLVGDLVVEVLPRVRIDAEERFLQQERFSAQDAVLEVDQPFGVERLAVICLLYTSPSPRDTR